MPTHKWVLYGHHFAAIAGAGPLVGPVLAAQMGFLPGTLWILAGVVTAGAVQDFIVLFVSVRRDGKSLGEMIKMELGPIPGSLALVGVLAIMIIILAVLALVVVKALTASPWGLFTIFATIPIALLMGCYMRFIRPGRVGEASVFGVVLLLVSIFLGRVVAEDPTWAPLFTLSGTQLAWALIVYGAIAVSRTTLWRMVQEGSFPPPVRVTQRNAGYLARSGRALDANASRGPPLGTDHQRDASRPRTGATWATEDRVGPAIQPMLAVRESGSLLALLGYGSRIASPGRSVLGRPAGRLWPTRMTASFTRYASAPRMASGLSAWCDGDVESDAAGRVEPGQLRVLVHRLQVDDPGLEHAHAIEGLHDRLVDHEAREGARREEVLAPEADR